jgi:hypothetical protein
MLEQADLAIKAELYDELGLRLTYQPDEQLVVIESRPACTTGGVGGPRTPTLTGDCCHGCRLRDLPVGC